MTLAVIKHFQCNHAITFSFYRKKKTIYNDRKICTLIYLTGVKITRPKCSLRKVDLSKSEPSTSKHLSKILLA